MATRPVMAALAVLVGLAAMTLTTGPAVGVVNGPPVLQVAGGVDSPEENTRGGDDDSDPENGGSGRLTWGVVPSGPEGPTGRSWFELELEPGESLVDYVGVINYAFDELTVDVYAQDAFTTVGGGFDILSAAGTSTGAGTWIDLDTGQVTIPPRSRVDVPFRLTVPERATPGDHAAGIVAAVSTAGVDADGSRVGVDRRVGARVYLRIAGDLEPSLTIEQLDARYNYQLNPLAAGTVTFTYRVTNTGNVRLAGEPTVTTAGVFGSLSRHTEGEPLPELLPGESFTTTAELSGVWPLMWLDADLGIVPIPPDTPGPDVSVSAVSMATVVWAIPWQHLGLLLVAAAVWFIPRRRRRRQARSGEPPHPDHADADVGTPTAHAEVESS